LVFGCFERKTFQRHGGVLKRDPLSNVDTSQFSTSKHPQTGISPKKFSVSETLGSSSWSKKHHDKKPRKTVEI